MKTLTQFSKNIRYLRNYFGLNQSGLTKMLAEKDSRIQLHPSTISAWERGLTTNPTARTVSWVAKAFNDFTPFTLTGHMLLYDDLEDKFHEKERATQNVQDRISSIEKDISDLTKHLQHCIYRIQTLEEERSKANCTVPKIPATRKLDDSNLLPILNTLGLYENNGRFFTHNNIDITDYVVYLNSIITSKNTP